MRERERKIYSERRKINLPVDKQVGVVSESPDWLAVNDDTFLMAMFVRLFFSLKQLV